MNYLGVTYSIGAKPELDPGFIPFGVWMDAYLKDAKKPIAIAIERDRGQVSVRKTFIHGTPDMAKADYRYVERLVKFLLWSIGGFKVYVCGCDHIAKQLQADYSENGKRAFDYDFFHKLYEVNLEIIGLPLDKCPAPNESTQPLGGHMDGCRIGFDAGGSDRKVSAVIDGECVYSEEVVWFPKLNEDPNYQYNEILTAFRTAASKMPRVDAIGVSSAGTFIGNAPMISSIFYKVPRSRWDEVKTCYRPGRCRDRRCTHRCCQRRRRVRSGRCHGSEHRQHHGPGHGHLRGRRLCGRRQERAGLDHRAGLCPR